MALLKKYQIDALKTEIYNKIQKTPNPKRETKEYKEYVSELTKEVTKLQKERDKIQKQLDDIEAKIKEPFNFGVWINRVGDKDIQKQADTVFEVVEPTQSEVERTIILTDLNGSENIVTTVLEKLGYNNNNN